MFIEDDTFHYVWECLGIYKEHILNITFMIFEFPRYIKDCSTPSMELAAIVMVHDATLATLPGKWPFPPEAETKITL